jgi:hypothetical protein
MHRLFEWDRSRPNAKNGRRLDSTIDQNTATILRSNRLAGGKTMWDIGCVGASMLFFVVAIGYAMGCDRLGAKETQR